MPTYGNTHHVFIRRIIVKDRWRNTTSVLRWQYSIPYRYVLKRDEATPKKKHNEGCSVQTYRAAHKHNIPTDRPYNHFFGIWVNELPFKHYKIRNSSKAGLGRKKHYMYYDSAVGILYAPQLEFLTPINQYTWVSLIQKVSYFGWCKASYINWFNSTS